MSRFTTVTMTLAVSAALCGCAVSQPHLSADFGAATRQSVVAQIADPDAAYRREDAPGFDGARAALAQQRYRTGTVIQPVATASKIGASSSTEGQ